MEGMYQPYLEYTDTEIRGLGNIPIHWLTKKANYLFSFGRGLNITKANLEDTGIPCVNYGEVHSKYGFEVDPCRHSLRCVSNDYITSSPHALLSNGDVVFADTSEDIEGSGNFTQFIGEGRMFAGYHTVILRPYAGNDPRFLAYAFDSQECRNQVRQAVKGVKVFSITQEILKNVALWLPSFDEQRSIAAFLNYETAKIDTLIDKQQQLIQLLKEKRQAVISHAVTKGLDPNVPMKDSGVEWLGEVPDHWVVSRVKNIVTKIVDGPHFSPKYHDDGYMFISARNIKTDRWSLHDAKYVSEADFNEFNRRVRPEIGDVLLTKGGTTGIARAVDLDFPFQVWVHVAVLKTIQTIMDPFYLAYVLNGKSCYEQSQLYTFGATNNDLGLSRIAKIIFARPPLIEQRKLRFWLDSECKRFDALIAKGVECIELAKERRTALISAAVTGKIDVRNWQPSDSQTRSLTASCLPRHSDLPVQHMETPA